MSLTLKWKRLHPQAQLPRAATGGAACFDLSSVEELTLKPGEIRAIATGLAVEVPQGFEMQVRARSGLALKSGLALVNGVGTIDSDYRGEIKVIVSLFGPAPLQIKSGDRIAQALVAPVLRVAHEEVAELSSTERGAGGFGSSGVAGASGYKTLHPSETK